jgi:hypothetical protein
MKKIILTGLSLLSPFYLQAEDTKKPFSGVYILGKLGGVYLKGEHKITTSAGEGTTSMASFGADFGGGVGYAMLTNGKAFFGGEGYYDMYGVKANKKMMTTQPQGDVSVQHKSGYGAALLLGAAANPKLVMYVKAGFEFNNFQINHNNTNDTPANRKSAKKTKGIVPGTGILMRLGDHFIVGGEYAYPLYKKIEVQGSTNKYTLKPIEHRINLRVMWLF